MFEIRLSSPIISLVGKGDDTFGGNQRLFDNPTMRGYGCGVIAAADLLYYLALTRPDYATPYTGVARSNYLSFEQYSRMCARLRASFMPIIPRFGKTGPALAAGLNMYFSRYSIPYRARWCIGHDKLFDRIEDMLSRDIPVIFSVGANFPIFWGKKKVNLYTRSPEGEMRPTAGTKAHFMTVVGLSEDYFHVSSWGKEYFISRKEYADYVKAHGSTVTSNIMYIKAI
ncbi:MAG: hypothetical protein IKV79_04885 [Oscillospiraceae bacterium]|nr:hypothetical protein [Oscillospiraceae bacterium]